MAIKAVYYISATGEIRGTYTHPDDVLVGAITALMQTGEAYVTVNPDVDVTMDRWYYPAGVRTARPDFDPTMLETYIIEPDNTDTVTILNMPIGTVVSLDYGDVVYAATVSVQNLTFKTAISGVFQILIEPPFPYRVRQIEVTSGDRD